MVDALQRLVKGLEDDAELLLQPEQLHRRLDALDVLDAHLLAGPELHLEADLMRPGDMAEAAALRQRARQICVRFEAANEALYAAIRIEVQQGSGPAALLRWVPAHTATTDLAEPVAGVGYDSLDELISGVFAFDEPQSQPASLSPEMVFYQPTPARHILRAIAWIKLTAADVLVDLGSGLGHVPLLVGMCTGARSVGIELEAGYVACARQCARRLHLQRVSFFQQDARTADLSTGTVFYLHTPFTGTIMRSVLDRLKGEAEARPIRICSYGPCTAVLAQEPWLQAVRTVEADQVAVFESNARP